MDVTLVEHTLVVRSPAAAAREYNVEALIQTRHLKGHGIYYYVPGLLKQAGRVGADIAGAAGEQDVHEADNIGRGATVNIAT